MSPPAGGYPAVTLFVERARASESGFALDGENVSAVAEIAVGWTAFRLPSSWPLPGSEC